jgi:hypothetical protein
MTDAQDSEEGMECGNTSCLGHLQEVRTNTEGTLGIQLEEKGPIIPVLAGNNCALPSDSQSRKTLPIATGVIDYFPAAFAELAKLSKLGNDKHNPGQPLHWSRGKSSDHADCIMRHLIDRGVIDPEDGLSHTTKVAWRALALLQEELEGRGAPLARGARVDA